MPQDFTTGQVLTAAQMDTLSGAVDGYATTATAAGTTTLTTASMYEQFFTGSTTQTVVMPVASTLYTGQKFRIVNNSSGVVTVQSSGANTIYAVPASSDVMFTCILASGTTAASWDYKDYVAAGSSPALVKVKASTFTAVANTSTTFDGVFTSTYKKYMVVFNGCISSGGVAVNIALRVAGVTIANNYGLSNQTDYTGGSTNVLANNAATVNVGTWATSIGTNLNLLFTAVGNASERAAVGGIGSSGSAYGVLTVGFIGNTGVVDGFIITPASGTITGTITVYGLAN